MDTYPISGNSLEKFYHIDGNQLGQQYKAHLSDYKDWAQKDHADQWMLFPDNIGPRLGIDETAISNRELYTIITNKDGHGRKGTIVAINEETNEMENAKLNGVRCRPKKYENGETKKEILFRSRLLLFKSPEIWTLKQKKRASILFKLYPDIKTASALVHRLNMIHATSMSVSAAKLKLVLWYNQVTDAEFEAFNSLAASIYAHSF